MNSNIRDKDGNYLGMCDKLFKSLFFGDNDEFTLWYTKKLLSNLRFVSLKREPVELASHNVKEKGKILDTLLNLDDDKYLIDIEVNSTYSKGIREKGCTYIFSVYSQSHDAGYKYDESKHALLIDICDDMPLSIFNKDIEKYYMQDDIWRRYVRNIEIRVFNVAKIMIYWYNKDVVNINKYLHIIMLKLGPKDLNKLIEYVTNDEDKIYIEYYRKELISMNSQEIRFHMPFNREDLDEMARKIDMSDARNEGLTVGRQVGIEETKIDNAINLLRKGIDPSVIVECIKLPLKTVLELKATL